MLSWLILFVLGLCVGSFLNVVIYREVKGKSWLKGRSYCDHCKKKLAWYDNLPLLSFILLQGKCRFCHKKIPLQYPLIEFLTGIEFVWIYWLFERSLTPLSRFEGFYSFLTLLVWLGLAVVATVIFVADWRFRIIPDAAVFGGIFLAFFKIWLDYRYTGMIDFSLLSSSILASLFFLFLFLVTHGKGMGIGDIKLAFLIGLVLGFPKILLALYFAFLTGAILGVILVLLGKKKLKSQLAFGPFLVAGTVFALFFGEQLWQLLMF